MKYKLLLAMFILSMLQIAIAETALAQTVFVGVTEGHAFDYDYNLFWQSTDPAAVVPAEFVDFNKTQWIRITITDVSGFTISLAVTQHYKNGTENTQNGNIDINKQQINAPYGFLIIRANSSADEKIYPLGGHTTINETLLRTYSVGQRETSHSVFTKTEEGYYEKTEMFFDRATGAALEYQFETRETSGSYVSTIKETITIRSWIIPEFPTFAIMMLVVAGTPLILILRKKLTSYRKNKEHQIEKRLLYLAAIWKHCLLGAQ